jgi:hypothetical protein
VNQEGYIWIEPELFIEGNRRELFVSGYPVASSPFINMQDDILKIDREVIKL